MNDLHFLGNLAHLYIRDFKPRFNVSLYKDIVHIYRYIYTQYIGMYVYIYIYMKSFTNCGKFNRPFSMLA